MTQQSAETTNTSYKMSNAVVGNKRVYMRARDVEEYEKELETSRLQMENPDDPASNSEQPENPNSAENSNKPVDWQKRYSDLQSHTTKQLNEFKTKLDTESQKRTELESRLKESTSNSTPPASEEELQDWIKQFPPLYNIMKTIIMKENTAGAEELKKSIKELEEFKQSVANERGRTELLKLHPDANEIEKDQRFGQWYEEQEPEIKALIDSGLPSKIGKAITLYKREVGIVTKSVQEKNKEASRAINLGPQQPNLPKEEKVWRESEVQKMSARDYERYEPAIEKARADGRYIRDLTG